MVYSTLVTLRRKGYQGRSPWLVGTSHIAMGMIVFVVGEVLKLVLVERLFSVSRNKLISIPAFARTYGGYLQAGIV
jgi:hypothetical protein